MPECTDAISLDITQCLKVPLSFWGKIDVIKMNITERLMYILREIPMLISIRYFTQISKLMIT